MKTEDMEKDEMSYHFASPQKGIFDGEIMTVKLFVSKFPASWVAIDGVVHAAMPASGYSINGILFPIKESEAFIKSEYKERYGIDIPENIHQWPYKVKDD